MLVLTRRINQSIMIGDDIEIVVIEASGDQVRLGIKAPQNIIVHRKEVVERIEAGEPTKRMAVLENHQTAMSHQE